MNMIGINNDNATQKAGCFKMIAINFSSCDCISFSEFSNFRICFCLIKKCTKTTHNQQHLENLDQRLMSNDVAILFFADSVYFGSDIAIDTMCKALGQKGVEVVQHFEQHQHAFSCITKCIRPAIH